MERTTLNIPILKDNIKSFNGKWNMDKMYNICR